MINYKKKITLNSMGDSWYLQSDRGDRYETFEIDNTNTPWTRWWDMQNQSDLRSWQKDIFRDFATKWRDIRPFVIYKRNSGHSQPHDLCLARSLDNEVWILSTERDFWFLQSNFASVDFTLDQSMGSVLDPVSRREIMRLRDALEYD